MEKVGGYDQLLKLPIPTLLLIIEDMNKEAEEQKAEMEKSKKGKR